MGLRLVVGSMDVAIMPTGCVLRRLTLETTSNSWNSENPYVGCNKTGRLDLYDMMYTKNAEMCRNVSLYIYAYFSSVDIHVYMHVIMPIDETYKYLLQAP